MFTLLLVQILLPVTFGYSPSSRKNLEAVVMRQLRRWKWLWRRSLTSSHKRTCMGPSRRCWNDTTSALLPEEVTTKGTRVSCVYNQEKCPYEKKSGNLFNEPRMWIIYVVKFGFLKKITMSYRIRRCRLVIICYIYYTLGVSGWNIYDWLLIKVTRDKDDMKISWKFPTGKKKKYGEWSKKVTHCYCVFTFLYTSFK